MKLGLDDAVSAIASVTEVALSPDLQVAKVYISVYSDPEGRDIAMRGLSRLEGYATFLVIMHCALYSLPHINAHTDTCIYVLTHLHEAARPSILIFAGT